MRTLRLSALGASALGLFVLSACASARRDHHLPEIQRLEARVAQLDAESARLRVSLDSLRAQNDSLRYGTSRVELDLRDREELVRALRLELERLKEIDLRPRVRRPLPESTSNPSLAAIAARHELR